MVLLEPGYLEDYLAIAQHVAGCRWAQLLLCTERGETAQAASDMDERVAAVFAALRGMGSDEPVFVDDCSAAAFEAKLAARLAAAGVRACAVVAAPLGHAGAAEARAAIVLADTRVRGWENAQRTALLRLLRVIAGHVAVRFDQAEYAEQLEYAQTLAHVGSWTHEPRSGRMRLSPELERMLNLPQACVAIGLNDFLAAVYPEDRARVAHAHQAMLKGSVDAVEYRLAQSLGQVRWVREHPGVRPGRRGAKVLTAAVRDITSEKRNAEMQQALQQEAERAQQQFRALFESAPTPYVVLTPDRYRIVAVSDTYLNATMVKREQIMGREMFDVFPDDPDDPQATGVAAMSASLDRVRMSKMPDVMAVQRYPVRRAPEQGGGFEVRYWSPVNSPVLDANRNVAFIIHRAEDVTDYVLAQQAGRSQLPSSAGERQEAEIVLRLLELNTTVVFHNDLVRRCQ